MTTHAGLYGPETLLDGAGRPRRLTNVVVYQGDGVTPAVLYADRTKATTLPSNAVQTDSDGNLAFYADPGMHVIRWTSAGVTRTLTVEVPVDYADVGSGPGGGGAVSSVFGRIGDVLLTKADVVGTGLAPDDIGADAAGAAATRQPLDADLTAIAALDASTAGTLATDGAGWIKKTYAQLKAALGITTSDVSGFTAAAAAAAPVQSVAGRTGAVTLSSADLSDKGAAGGVASLDGSGKVPQAQVPSVALTDFLGAVASQAAMLALTGQRGDWCTRTDLGTDWQLIADDPTQLANWRQHVYPASPVSSVAGRTGAVVLSTADVSGLGTAATHPATDFDAAGAAAAVLGQPLALAGATQPTRYVGRWAATGAPTSGTFAVGDFGFDGTNTLRICTAAGTPGTWASSGASLARDVPNLVGSAGMTRAVSSAGKMVVGFGSGLWLATSGTVPLTQGYSGFDANGNRTGIVSRTGQSEMLVWTPASDSAQSIQLQSTNSAGSNLLAAALGGRIGLWVYVENQPGFQAGGTVQGTLTLTLSTLSAFTFTNALSVSFNTNQVREGWNYLKFVQRDPTAYVPGGSTSEDHPLGVLPSAIGTGADTDIVNNPVKGIRIDASNLGGATLYFDSMWTGVTATPQVVLGCDLQAQNLIDYALPIFAANGWIGYTAAPARVWDGVQSRVLSDLTPSFGNAQTLYGLGWDNINHTTNHLPGTTTTPSMADLTNAAEIAYEVGMVEGLYLSRGLRRGGEFYASPQSRTSRLAEKVIREAGFLLQRHNRKWNVTVTPFGIDNPHHVGSTDLGHTTGSGYTTVTAGAVVSTGGAQVYSKIKKHIDVLIAYGDAWFPFWHNISTLGDSGSGEDLTGDNLVITLSAFSKSMDYLKAKEDAGQLRVRDGFTGFYYGVGR